MMKVMKTGEDDGEEEAAGQEDEVGVVAVVLDHLEALHATRTQKERSLFYSMIGTLQLYLPRHSGEENLAGVPSSLTTSQSWSNESPRADTEERGTLDDIIRMMLDMKGGADLHHLLTTVRTSAQRQDISDENALWALDDYVRAKDTITLGEPGALRVWRPHERPPPPDSPCPQCRLLGSKAGPNLQRSYGAIKRCQPCWGLICPGCHCLKDSGCECATGTLHP